MSQHMGLVHNLATSCSTRYRAKVHWIVGTVPLSGCFLLVETMILPRVEVELTMMMLTVPVQATSADSKDIEVDEFVADYDAAVSDRAVAELTLSIKLVE